MRNKIFLIPICWFFASGMHAQVAECNYGQSAVVTASSGLTIRQQPRLKAGVVGYASYRDTVALCRQKMGELSVEGTSGQWRPVHYQEHYGYIFDGFLELLEKPENYEILEKSRTTRATADSLLGQGAKSASNQGKEPSSTEAKSSRQVYWQGASQVSLALEMHNYCGSVKDLNPGLEWFGFYPSKEDSNFYKIQPVELRVMVSKRQLYDDLEYDISTEREERSQFLLGLDRRLQMAQMNIPDHEQEFRYRGRQLLPGQVWRLGGAQKMQLEALGRVLKSGDCPELEDYRLNLSWRENGQRKSQNLNSMLPESNSCKVVDLYWYGDLSGDQKADFILVSQLDAGQTFTLFTGDAAGPQQLVVRKTQFTLPNCKANESGTE